MRYEVAVAAAAGALKRGEAANWELSELTWEHTFAGRGDTDAQRALGKAPLSAWCKDVREVSKGKFSDATGLIHRQIWERFRSRVPGDRPSWTKAYREVLPSAGLDATLQRHTNQHLKQATPERKRELIVRLLNDPELGDLGLLDQLNDLLRARRREARGMPPEPKAKPVEEQEAAQAADPYGVSGTIRLAMCLLDGRAAAEDFADELRRCPTLTPEARALVREDLARVVADWQRLDALVEGGSVLTDIEGFLAERRMATENTAE